MNVLNKKEFYTYPEFMTDENMPIVGEVWCDDDNSLPSVTEFSGYKLITGSRAYTPNKTYILSGTTWVLKDQSPFSNVYTKTEVNALLTPITDDITSLDGRVDAVETTNSDQDSYIYALICRSSLNYLPDTIWDGATTAGSGYICQNLAITLPAGNYIWKMKRDGNTSTSMTIRDSSNNTLYSITRGAGVNDITQSFTISAAAATISIYAGYSINFSQNMIFKDLSTSNRSLRMINQINEEDAGQDDREEEVDR